MALVGCAALVLMVLRRDVSPEARWSLAAWLVAAAGIRHRIGNAGTREGSGLWYTVRTYRSRRRECSRLSEGRNLVQLRSPRAVDAWLATQMPDGR